MKSRYFFFVLLALLTVAGCKYDDALLVQQLKDHEMRIAALENLRGQMVTNIQSLQTITEALSERDFVTSVIPVRKEETVVGYTIIFEKAGAVTVYNGNGDKVPAIAVKQDTESLKWCWTLDGEWVLDADGKKMPAEGEVSVTPQLKVDDGWWFISYDEGKTWSKVMQEASYMIKEVTFDNVNVYLTFADGTVITLLRVSSADFNLPFGIVMLSSGLTDVFKDDTVTFSIRVNPSDYTLDPAGISFLKTSDIYTRLVNDNDPFDETAGSDFKLLGLKSSKEGEGIYDLLVAVNGTGSYYEDARLWVIVSARDSWDSLRSVCSATPVPINVIPHLSEGLQLEAVSQSFYIRDSVGNRAQKPYYVGMWANTFRNRGGALRVYDRAAVSDISYSSADTTAVGRIDTRNAIEHGIIELMADTTALFWLSALENYRMSGLKNVSVPGVLISVSRREEHESFPISYTCFFDEYSLKQQTLSISEIKAGDNRCSFDLSAELASMGYFPDREEMRYNRKADNLASDVQKGLAVFDKTTNILTIRYYSNPALADREGRIVLMFQESIGSQSLQGLKELALPPDVNGTLLEVTAAYRINYRE